VGLHILQGPAACAGVFGCGVGYARATVETMDIVYRRSYEDLEKLEVISEERSRSEPD
jgi:hypothetical protein